MFSGTRRQVISQNAKTHLSGNAFGTIDKDKLTTEAK